MLGEGGYKSPKNGPQWFKDALQYYETLKNVSY